MMTVRAEATAHVTADRELRAEPEPAPAGSARHSVMGVLVSAVDYHEATEQLLAAARQRRSFSFTALAVHGVMTGVKDRTHQARLNGFDVVAPDGQPVRWALNWLYGTELAEWVSGPELVGRVLRRMAQEGMPVYLYGATPPTLRRLAASLRQRFPGLGIAGAEPSKFRSAAPGEADEIAGRVNRSGARLLLVGLGCPRQEVLATALRPLLNMPVMAVGAAFDYHAGNLRRAPRWMERHGLAWLWRLGREPSRLWRRYLLLNPEYLLRLAAQKARLWRPAPALASRQRPVTIPV